MRFHIPQRHITVITGYARCRLGTMLHFASSFYVKPSQGWKAKVMFCLLIALSLSLCSCTQKDLVFPDKGLCKIDIRFIWDEAFYASPEGMTLLFYPLEENEEFWRYEISGKKGGAVEIPQGTYTMIAINNELPGISLIDMPYESASLTVKEMPRSQAYGNPTGMVYMGRIDKLKVSSRNVTYIADDGMTKASDVSVIDCYPDSLSTMCHIIADEVSGIEKIKSASAVIEGFASGLLLSSRQPMLPTVTVPLNLETDVDNARLTGYTSGFLSNPSSASYLLTIRVTYNEGGAYEKTYDVTDLIINYFYQHNVYIIIRGLTLPEEPTIKPDEVGIKVDVDGWKVVDIDIDSTNY